MSDLGRITRREQRDDVGMLQPRGEGDLALEAVHRNAAGEFGRQDLANTFVQLQASTGTGPTRSVSLEIRKP